MLSYIIAKKGEPVSICFFIRDVVYNLFVFHQRCSILSRKRLEVPIFLPRDGYRDDMKIIHWR
jgi:hypothetical protein